MSSSPKSSKSNKQGQKAVSRGYSSGKVLKYFNLRRSHPEYTKLQCRDESGYSEATHPDTIEDTKQFQALWEEHQELIDSLKMDIEERIKLAQKATGAGVKGNLTRLQTVIKRKGSKHDKNAIAAAKQVTEITGEKMPTEISATLSGDEELLASILSRHTT